MSKKKDEELTELTPIEQLKKDINKKYDSNVFVNAQEIIDKERKIVSISPALDIATGGILEGSWVILSGCPKSGKSTTALQIAANAQQQYNKQIFIGNVEHRLNRRELCGIHNLNPSNIEIIQSQKNKILSAQEYLEEFMRIIKNIEGCVLIIDSSSALCASGEYGSDITSAFRSDSPKLFATFCRRMCSVVPVQNTILIIVQHLITNTSNYGSPFYEDSGTKLQFQCDYKFRCTSFQKWEQKIGESEKRLGQIVNWQIMTSASSIPPCKVQSYIRYNYGIDDIKEIIDISLDFGIIEKNGPAWYILFGEKIQGEEKVRTYLLENPNKLEELKQKIKENI